MNRPATVTRAGLIAGVVALAGVMSCAPLFRLGPTSTDGTAPLLAAPRPAPVDSEFDGCGPAGSQPDYVLNRLKNRIDTPANGEYLSMPWTVIAQLPWPTWAGLRFRNQWTLRETDAVRQYEGAAVEIEGYVAGYRLEVPEPPNCYARDAAHKDFHLWLSRAPGQSKQSSIVVELTPRVRIRHAGWTSERLKALQRAQVPVRVRGWLMLDQMHPENVERNRRTLWEVHPVMELDWRDSAGVWLSLDSGRSRNRKAGREALPRYDQRKRNASSASRAPAR